MSDGLALLSDGRAFQGEMSWAIDIQNPKTHERIVMIKCTGELVYGPNYHPDQAAKAFWEAIALAAPHHEHKVR